MDDLESDLCEQGDSDTASVEEWTYRAGLSALSNAANALLPILEQRMNSPRYHKLATAFAFVQQECEEAGPRLVFGH